MLDLDHHGCQLMESLFGFPLDPLARFGESMNRAKFSKGKELLKLILQAQAGNQLIKSWHRFLYGNNKLGGSEMMIRFTMPIYQL